MTETEKQFGEWCILELMGHVRMAGFVTEEERFGVKMGRIEIPDGEKSTTVWFSGGSVYRCTPTTEEISRHVAASHKPAPVQRWELPDKEPIAASSRTIFDDDDLQDRGDDASDFPP